MDTNVILLPLARCSTVTFPIVMASLITVCVEILYRKTFRKHWTADYPTVLPLARQSDSPMSLICYKNHPGSTSLSEKDFLKGRRFVPSVDSGGREVRERLQVAIPQDARELANMGFWRQTNGAKSAFLYSIFFFTFFLPQYLPF